MKLFGLPTRNTQALKGCNQLLTKGLYQDQEIRFSRDQEIQDLGVSALVLSICSYFGYEDESLQRMAHFLAGQQCKAGNWLPNGLQSAEAYTFETTLLVLEALLQFRNRYPEEKSTATSTAVAKGQEFLLKHSLFLTLGGPMKSGWTSFAFPPYWFYDVLVALDYFRSFQMNRDGRIQPAIDLLLKRQTKDGLWMLGSQHPGKTYFEMEKAGKPSRWNTLRALRILEWWNNSSAMQPAT
jgi:hypothetical protein